MRTWKWSDRNLPGAIPRSDLVLTSTARVFSAATFPASSSLFLPASEPLTSGPFSIQIGLTLTKTGPGAMTINGAQNNGAGSNLIVNGGTVTLATSGGRQL